MTNEFTTDSKNTKCLSSADYGDRIYKILKNKDFSPNFISGIAGDSIQNDNDAALYARMLDDTSLDLYTALLFHITHEFFEKNRAKKLWDQIIEHKYVMSEKLGRNVQITVATLDFLTNIEHEILSPKLICESFVDKIAEMSSIDMLTKLHNRSHIEKVLETESIRYKRYKSPFSIMIIDVDKFKVINDTYGHTQGDIVLFSIAQLITKSLRELDICARYGGEEFMAVFPHTKITDAVEIANRIRISVQEYFSTKFNVTISIGLSSCPESGKKIKTLIEKADKALYIAKNNGRNAVRFV